MYFAICASRTKMLAAMTIIHEVAVKLKMKSVKLSLRIQIIIIDVTATARFK